MELDVPGQIRRCLDIWWACLGISRKFGYRLILAGQSCRCRVSVVHSGSRVEIVEVREQLGSQDILCIEVCGLYGGWVTPQSPTCEGLTIFHGPCGSGGFWWS